MITTALLKDTVLQAKILIVLGFNDTSTLVGNLCRLPEKGRKETEEIAEEKKEGEERGT